MRKKKILQINSPAMIRESMERPERRGVLAGVSPARVSARAPGSRLQPEGEIQPSQAECQKPLQKRGATQRAATISERNSPDIRQPKGVWEGRAAHVTCEGNRQHP